MHVFSTLSFPGLINTSYLCKMYSIPAHYSVFDKYFFLIKLVIIVFITFKNIKSNDISE